MPLKRLFSKVKAFSVLRNYLFYFHFEKTIMEPPKTRILRTGAVLLCKQLQQVLCLTRRRYTRQAVKWKCLLSFLTRYFYYIKFWDNLKSDPALMDPTKSTSSRIWSSPPCFVIFHGCECFSMRLTMVQSCITLRSSQMSKFSLNFAMPCRQIIFLFDSFQNKSKVETSKLYKFLSQICFCFK